MFTVTVIVTTRYFGYTVRRLYSTAAGRRGPLVNGTGSVTTNTILMATVKTTVIKLVVFIPCVCGLFTAV